MSKKVIVSIVVVAVLVIGGGVALLVHGNAKDDASATTSTSDESAKVMAEMDMKKAQPDSQSAATDTTPVAATSVTIENFAYSPATITVKKGTKVTWTNQDSVRHDVTSDNGSGPSSELLAKGTSYSYTFDTVGTFTYHCTPHPYMKGTVIVTE